MCGIAGIWRFGDSASDPSGDARAADERALDAMLAAIRHRGPDDERKHLSAHGAVGVRRLSIIDLAGGAQPLSDESGDVWAGNNGELYNYRDVRQELVRRGHTLRTHSDTEILPHLYEDHGPDFARAIEGMFACFVVDVRRRRLVLARDRFGVKPLYYAQAGGRLWFASELRCLRADPRFDAEVDPARFEDYLALGYVPGEATIYRGVRRLPPGHRLVVDDSGLTVEPFDAPSGPSPVLPADDAGLIAELERLLAGSIERQLVSDVPLGILLSGGLDSSVLTALLPEAIRRDALTFCVGFADGGHHDERAIARAVAAHLGTRHVERTLELDARAWTLRAGAHLDEPLADPAAVPALAIADAASQHVKVLLSGTGGDELFGGYRRHRLAGVRRMLAPVPAGLAGRLSAGLAGKAGSRRTAAAEWMVFAGKALEARASADFLEAYVRAQAPGRDADWNLALGRTPLGAGPVRRLVERLRLEPWPAVSPEETAFEFDRRYYLPDDLLLKEDRMTMACSVEGRVPYLDERLAAFARALPLDAKIRGGTGKWILRAVARRHVPEAIVARPKHGFSVPVTEWLRGPLAPLLEEMLAPGSASPMWDSGVLARWMGEHRSGTRDRGGLLWSALMWELWWRSPSGPGGQAPPR